LNDFKGLYYRAGLLVVNVHRAIVLSIDEPRMEVDALDAVIPREKLALVKRKITVYRMHPVYRGWVTRDKKPPGFANGSILGRKAGIYLVSPM